MLFLPKLLFDSVKEWRFIFGVSFNVLLDCLEKLSGINTLDQGVSVGITPSLQWNDRELVLLDWRCFVGADWNGFSEAKSLKEGIDIDRVDSGWLAEPSIC